MDSLGGLFKFFYNIIPGALFLLGLNTLGIPIAKMLPSSDFEKIFWILIVGIFLGFLGQGFMKILKINKINHTIYKEIEKDNTESGIYSSAMHKIKVHLNTNKTILRRDFFYTMDNHLRNNSTMYIVNDFAEKAAFWGNIFIASSVLLLISFYNISLYTCAFYSLVNASLYLFHYYTRSEFDSVLKTYSHISARRNG